MSVYFNTNKNENIDIFPIKNVNNASCLMNVVNSFQPLDQNSMTPKKNEQVTHYQLERMDLSVKNSDLPEVYQLELKNKISDELSISIYLFNRLYSICGTVYSECGNKYKKLFCDTSILVIYFCHNYSNIVRDLQKNLIVEQTYTSYLANAMLRMKEQIEEIRPLLSKGLQTELASFLNITNELLRSLNGEGLDLRKYDCLLRNVKERNHELTTSLNNVLSKSREARNSFSLMRDTLIGGLAPRLGDHELWEGMNEIFTSYTKNLKNRNKKTITFNNLLGLYQYTYEKFKPFVMHSTKIVSLELTSLINFLPSKELIDTESYGLDPLIKSLSPKNHYSDELNEIFFNYQVYNTFAKLLKTQTLELRQEILFSIASEVQSKGLSVNINAVANLIQLSREMVRQLEGTQFSIESKRNRIITYNGQESISSIFTTIGQNVKVLEKKFENIVLSESTYTVTDLYLSTFWISYQLNITINNCIKDLIAEIKDEIEETSNLRKLSKNEIHLKMKVRLQEKKLEAKLNETKELLNVLETCCKPVFELIDKFKESFLLENSVEASLAKEESHLEIGKIEEAKAIATLETFSESPPERSVEASKEQPSLEVENMDEIKAITTFETFSESSESKIKPNKNRKLSEKKFDIKDVVVTAQDELKKQADNNNQGGTVHNVKWRDLVQEVLDAGYQLLRQKGSHMQFANSSDLSQGLVTIPRHGNKNTVCPGVVKSVRKQMKKK